MPRTTREVSPTSNPPSPIAPLEAVFRSVVTTVVPEADGLDETGWTELERLVEEALRVRPRALQRRLRVFLRLIQWAAWLRFGRPFTSLEPGQRARWLQWLETHPIRTIRVGFWGLRALVFLGYYGQTSIAQAIGYKPEARGWEGLK